MQVTPDQKGFAAVEAVLVIIIIALVGFTGYFVWHSRNQTTALLDAGSSESKSVPAANAHIQVGANKVQLDNSKVTVGLPQNWLHAAGAGICHTDNDINCLDSMEAAPSDIAKAQSNDAFGVGVAVLPVSDGKSPTSWFFVDYLHAVQTSQYKVTSETVNGNKGLAILDNGGSYQDVYHVVLHNDLAVVTTARVSDYSYEPGTTKIASIKSYSQYVPDVSAIAHSVEFN